MLCSSVTDCTDIDEFQSAICEIDNEIVITGAGAFSARVVEIDLHRLRIQRIDEALARAWRVQMEHPRMAVGFSATAGPEALMRCQGIKLTPHDLAVFTAADPVWHMTSGPSQFATMSLSSDDLAELGVALLGHSFMPPDPTIARVPPARMARLLWLHAAAAYLAENSPEIIADPNAARGLEASLTEAMATCLAEGNMRSDTACQRRHAFVIKRLRELEEAHRDCPLYLPDVCKAVGVSLRSLNYICQEVLGVGPKHNLNLRRLHLVHRELRKAVPGQANVTQIATQYGFWELGRFAAVYRKTFGQLPSEILRQI